MVAAHAPAASPATAPAARNRVGASFRNDHNNPAKIGTARASTNHGHTLQLFDSHLGSHSSEGVLASSPMPLPPRTSTGISSNQSPRNDVGTGRARRAIA